MNILAPTRLSIVLNAESESIKVSTFSESSQSSVQCSRIQSLSMVCPLGILVFLLDEDVQILRHSPCTSQKGALFMTELTSAPQMLFYPFVHWDVDTRTKPLKYTLFSVPVNVIPPFSSPGGHLNVSR